MTATKTKHTPGPWTQTGPFNAVITAATRTICELPMDLRNEELQANARLIAEAPAMVDALRALCAWGDEREEKLYPGAYTPWTAARALIARIDGTNTP